MIRTHEIGRLADAPDIRFKDGNISSAVFTVASDRWTHAGKKTDFVRHVAFADKAEFAQKYLRKGTKIYIEGHIITDSYDKDGRTIYTTDIQVDRYEFCESKGEKAENDRAEAIAIDDQEELPFK